MKHKVTAFTMAPISAGAFGGKGGKTVRVVIPVNITGDELVFRFSNREGIKPAVMDCATVAPCDEQGTIRSNQVRTLTFGSKPVLTMKPGKEAESDPVKMKVCPGMYLALSLYCRKQPVCTSSLGMHAFASAKKGNFCHENFTIRSQKSIMERLMGLPIGASIPYFRALDIVTEDVPVVISCLGDSITMQCQWYTPLLKRLYREHPGKCCLLNAGISGNRLMNDTPPMKLGAVSANMFGSAGFKRLEWDTLADHGVDRLLLESPLADAPQVNGNALLISKLGTEIVALALHFSFDYATIVADSAI